MTTLEANNYREQPDFPCCVTCKHCYYGYDSLDCCGLNDLLVGPVGLCDRYEPEEE